jgi:nicotinamide-nucleotide amidase
MKPHLTAAILSIGDELTLGQGLDTNSQWLSQRLVEAGITPVEHATVPDSLERTRDAILRLAEAADLVIVTGGLGPTADDLTRASLAAAMGDSLVEDAESLAQIVAWFAGRSRPMPELNRVQALRPSRAISLRNPAGTAPGMREYSRGMVAMWMCSVSRARPGRCGRCGRSTCSRRYDPAGSCGPARS